MLMGYARDVAEMLTGERYWGLLTPHGGCEKGLYLVDQWIKD